MALSVDDHKQLGEILKPLADATKEQSETLKEQAEALGKFGNRWKSVGRYRIYKGVAT